jgi:hypothetical protein
VARWPHVRPADRCGAGAAVTDGTGPGVVASRSCAQRRTGPARLSPGPAGQMVGDERLLHPPRAVAFDRRGPPHVLEGHPRHRRMRRWSHDMRSPGASKGSVSAGRKAPSGAPVGCNGLEEIPILPNFHESSTSFQRLLHDSSTESSTSLRRLPNESSMAPPRQSSRRLGG